VWLRRSLPSVGQPVAAHRHGQAPGRVHAGTFTRLGWRATIRAADMPDKPIIRERIDRILARYGITPAMVREHITTHYGWFREFSPASRTNFRALFSDNQDGCQRQSGWMARGSAEGLGVARP
jgi:hypothetical protein